MAVRKRRAGGGAAADAQDDVIETPIAPRRQTVSEILRDRRIECGLEVEHVAQVLRIRPAVLEAIEAGQFDQMPGPAYAVGFVRSYATYLGLDSEALVLRFKAEAAEVARRPNLHFPLPVNDGRVPTRPLLIIGVLLAAIIYAGWYYFSANRHDLADLVPPVPERLKHLLSPDQVKQDVAANADRTRPAVEAPATAQPQPGTTAPSQPAPNAAAPVPPATGTSSPPSAATAPSAAALPPAGAATQAAQPSAPGQAASLAAVSAAPVPEADGVPPVEDRANAPAPVAALPSAPDLAQPAPSEAGKGPAQTSYGAPDGQARIVLRATADSWIQVRDNQGNLLITRILKPGESYNVPNQPGLSLVTGNAGGLDIVVDGNTLPKIGESGRVARDVTLDADRLLSRKARAK